jgi:hypothetical protein
MVSQEEAEEILRTATDLETVASAALSFLIYSTIGEIPSVRDIPIQLKALSIETVQALGRLK